MDKNRRAEDNISKEELMGKPLKDLVVETLLQAKQTNGQVVRNCNAIEKLQDEMKDKIGWKLFALISGVIAVIILIFNVFDRVVAL